MVIPFSAGFSANAWLQSAAIPSFLREFSFRAVHLSLDDLSIDFFFCDCVIGFVSTYGSIG
ncbi:hypothetical protein M6B38_156215 [Iris pallida]|uniref:Uncharacterized protein n=1 Tax=Iris pallida TaxID=29817 RepID=A0AAX6F462_IRIPA|nr:hypothetical protein M6B38_156215 [Iris pallida]